MGTSISLKQSLIRSSLEILSDMNNFCKFAITTTAAILVLPNISVSAFETEDLNQLQTFRVCNNACDLSNADLSEVYLVKANLENANLQGAYLNEVNLNKALLDNANLSESDLAGAYLRGATLQQTDLNEAKMNRADFKGVILNQANIQGTHLIEAKNLTATQIKSTCNWEQAIFQTKDDANQKFIRDLQQDSTSDPEKSIDCSIWAD